MLPLNVIIIDDEPDSGKLLSNLLSDFQVLNVKHIYSDAIKALETVILEQPDVVFSDIEMPRISGMEFLDQVNKLSPGTKVIFVTAFESYAIEAIHNNVFDYLCKPIVKTELRNVVHKLVASANTTGESSIQPSNNRLLLRTSEGYHYVSIGNILYLEAEGSYCNLTLTNNKKLLVSMNLGKMHEQLPGNEFLRISRKHIINRNFLTFMSFSKRYCVLSDNETDYTLDVLVKKKDIELDL